MKSLNIFTALIALSLSCTVAFAACPSYSTPTDMCIDNSAIISITKMMVGLVI